MSDLKANPIERDAALRAQFDAWMEATGHPWTGSHRAACWQGFLYAKNSSASIAPIEYPQGLNRKEHGND